jgi:hypothetical protein
MNNIVCNQIDSMPESAADFWSGTLSRSRIRKIVPVKEFFSGFEFISQSLKIHEITSPSPAIDKTP